MSIPSAKERRHENPPVAASPLRYPALPLKAEDDLLVLAGCRPTGRSDDLRRVVAKGVSRLSRTVSVDSAPAARRSAKHLTPLFRFLPIEIRPETPVSLSPSPRTWKEPLHIPP